MPFTDFALIETSTHQSVFTVNALKTLCHKRHHLPRLCLLLYYFLFKALHQILPCPSPLREAPSKTSGTNSVFAISRMSICLKIAQRKGSPGRYWPVLGSLYSCVCRSALPLPKPALSPPLCQSVNPRLKSSSNYLFSSTFIFLIFPFVEADLAVHLSNYLVSESTYTSFTMKRSRHSKWIMLI